MSHNMNLLISHFTISRALHSCETVNRKVNCGLTPNKNGNGAEFFLFRLLIKVNENHAFMQKNLSYLVVGVAYIHKEPPPVVDRTHRYEQLQLETVCILVRYSNTLTFSAHSNELVT